MTGIPSTLEALDRSDDRMVLSRCLLPGRQNLWSNTAPLLAIGLQLAISIFLAACAFIDLPLTPVGILMPTWAHTLYVTGTTIFASVATSFSISQIRRLWLAQTLRSSAFQQTGTTNSLRRTKTLLALGSLSDDIKHWDISLTIIFAGLITTSIVSGITPLPVSGTVPSSTNFNIDGLSCLTISDNASNATDLTWRLQNGSYIGINTTYDLFCPLRVSQSLLLGVQNTPERWAYVVDGTPVDHNSIGVAFDSYSGWFQSSFGAWGVSSGLASPTFQGASACMPILSTNPVRCRTGGSVRIGLHQVNVSTSSCNVSTWVYEVDPATQGAATIGACTSSSDIGMATILFGAVNDYATMLAQFIGNEDSNANYTSQRYSVVCDIDIAPSLVFRKLSYGRVSWSEVDEEEFLGLNGVEAVVTSNAASCQITEAFSNNPQVYTVADFQTPSALASGAAASFMLLAEGAYRDGWPTSLAQAILSNYYIGDLGRDNQYVFNDSTNPLEDVLGLTSALALGAFWGSEGIVETFAMVTMTGTRIGAGRWWAVVFCAPCVFVAISLAVLLWHQRKLPS